MTTPTTTGHGLVITDIVEAMRNIQTENERWQLAEALRVEIPSGSSGFERIVDAAAAAGVQSLSANTLRLYRDTANRWPADQRVENVSFSAHREAMVVQPISEARKLLVTLAANLGAAKVTVGAVRKAIAVKNGKPATPAAASAASTASTATVTAVDWKLAAIADLTNGGAGLVGSIDAGSSLDKLQAGLAKVLAHVEQLRSKAARKSAAAKKVAATPVAAAAKSTPTTKNTRKVVGDLRGL